MKLNRLNNCDVRWAVALVGIPILIVFIGLPMAGISLTGGGLSLALALLAADLPFALFILLAYAYPRQTLRWRKRLITTIAVGLGFVILHSFFICGCHFHPSAALLVLVPILWASYALGTYRDRMEQVVGWSAFSVAIFCLWLGFESNIIFAFE